MRAPLVSFLLLFAVSSFASLTPGTVVTEGRSVPVVADVNGDGLADLVQDTTVLVNQGGGAFVKHDLGLEARDVAIDWIDVNGDGRADLLAKDRDSTPPNGAPIPSSYRIYVAGDQLTFTAGPRIGTDGLPFVPYIAQLDADGKEDLLLVRTIHEGRYSVATELKVLLSRGDGTFEGRVPFRIGPDPQFGRYSRLLAGDVNHDAVPDVVIRTAHELVLLRGTGGGDFAAESRYLPFESFGGWATDLADVDGDGNLDVVMAFFRTVRVFFGDGRGRWTRMARVVIPQLREPTARRWTPLDAAYAQAPRNFGFGEFVGTGRTEIATATAEGDLIILAWENGTLRIVARKETEYVLPDVHAASWREPGRTDLYLTWNFGYGHDWKQPRFFYAEPAPIAAVAARPAGRSRAVRGTVAPVLNLNVQARGDCAPLAVETWSLAREGAFGADRNDGRNVEAVLENGMLYFRTTASWALAPVTGTLALKGRVYEGMVEASTPCGWKELQFKAVVR